MKEHYPNVIIDDVRYWQIACKKCQKAEYELFSDAKCFFAKCLNCEHTQQITVKSLLDEPEKPEDIWFIDRTLFNCPPVSDENHPKCPLNHLPKSFNQSETTKSQAFGGDAHIISKEQLSNLCVAFHKHFRVTDIGTQGEDADMCKAINNLPDESYPIAMASALEEINIKVQSPPVNTASVNPESFNTVSKKDSEEGCSDEGLKVDTAPTEEDNNIIDRIEIIDEKGRQYVAWDVDITEYRQDGGKTLKIHVKNKEKDAHCDHVICKDCKEQKIKGYKNMFGDKKECCDCKHCLDSEFHTPKKCSCNHQCTCEGKK